MWQLAELWPGWKSCLGTWRAERQNLCLETSSVVIGTSRLTAAAVAAGHLDRVAFVQDDALEEELFCSLTTFGGIMYSNPCAGVFGC